MLEFFFLARSFRGQMLGEPGDILLCVALSFYPFSLPLVVGNRRTVFLLLKDHHELQVGSQEVVPTEPLSTIRRLVK